MEALTKVLETIKAVLNMLKDFFADLFPQKDAEGEDAEVVA